MPPNATILEPFLLSSLRAWPATVERREGFAHVALELGVPREVSAFGLPALGDTQQQRPRAGVEAAAVRRNPPASLPWRRAAEGQDQRIHPAWRAAHNLRARIKLEASSPADHSFCAMAADLQSNCSNSLCVFK